MVWTALLFDMTTPSRTPSRIDEVGDAVKSTATWCLPFTPRRCRGQAGCERGAVDNVGCASFAAFSRTGQGRSKHFDELDEQQMHVEDGDAGGGADVDAKKMFHAATALAGAWA